MNAVGAGDACTAVFTHTLVRLRADADADADGGAEACADAFAWGMAAGAARCLERTPRIDPSRVRQLRAAVRIEPTAGV